MLFKISLFFFKLNLKKYKLKLFKINYRFFARGEPTIINKINYNIIIKKILKNKIYKYNKLLYIKKQCQNFYSKL